MAYMVLRTEVLKRVLSIKNSLAPKSTSSEADKFSSTRWRLDNPFLIVVKQPLEKMKQWIRVYTCITDDTLLKQIKNQAQRKENWLKS